VTGSPDPEAPSSPSWREACAAFAEREGGTEVLPTLAAFSRGERPTPARPFAELLAQARHDQAPAIRDVLSDEVDAAQAAMFARRRTALGRLLAELDGPAARVLEVGLWQRVEQVLHGPAPRALRVRAVVDFYMSQAALLRPGSTDGPDLHELIAELSWRSVAPGVAHAHLEGPSWRGPVHLNLLRLRGVRLAAHDTRHIPDFAAWSRAQGAAAAFSGGFFLYSEPDIAPPSRRGDPVNLLVSRGQVHSPPLYPRSALVQRANGTVSIEAIGLTSTTLRAEDGRSWRPVDRPPGPGEVRAWTRAHGRVAPPWSGDTLAVVGTESWPTSSREVPLHGALLDLPPGSASDVGAVGWTLDEPVVTGLSGGPRLLGPSDTLALEAEGFAGSAPPITFSQDETFDQNLLPRLGVGLHPDGSVIVAAIDGRNVDRAVGMTLRQTGELLAALGCTEALNLDGGSSKRMVVNGEVVDLPSTELVAGGGGAARVRPVHTGVLVYAGQATGSP